MPIDRLRRFLDVVNFPDCALSAEEIRALGDDLVAAAGGEGDLAPVWQAGTYLLILADERPDIGGERFYAAWGAEAVGTALVRARERGDLPSALGFIPAGFLPEAGLSGLAHYPSVRRALSDPAPPPLCTPPERFRSAAPDLRAASADFLLLAGELALPADAHLQLAAALVAGTPPSAPERVHAMRALLDALAADGGDLNLYLCWRAGVSAFPELRDEPVCVAALPAILRRYAELGDVDGLVDLLTFAQSGAGDAADEEARALLGMAGWWLRTRHTRDEGVPAAWRWVAESAGAYPALSRVLGYLLQAEPVALPGAEETETLRRELEQTLRDLDAELKPRPYRNVPLARRIHADNVSQVFAPLRDALTDDRPDLADLAEPLRALDARELVDKHPEQQTNPHPIEANLRVQLITDRGKIIDGLRRAAALRERLQQHEPAAPAHAPSLADADAARELRDYLSAHPGLAWAAERFLGDEDGGPVPCAPGAAGQPPRISRALLLADARQAAAAPHVLLRLRTEEIAVESYLDVFVEDAAAGLGAAEWGDLLAERGALDVASVCWSASDLDESDREERRRHWMAEWSAGVREAERRLRSALNDAAPGPDGRADVEQRLRQAEGLVSAEWFDLAARALDETLVALPAGQPPPDAERAQSDGHAVVSVATSPPRQPRQPAAAPPLAGKWARVLETLDLPEEEPALVEPSGPPPAEGALPHSPPGPRMARLAVRRARPLRRVGLFIDWENIKYSLRAHDEAPDVGALLAAARRFGRVVVARAYADWQEYDHRMDHDARRLYHAGVEPVYVPTRARALGQRIANSVDVKLATDCVEISFLRPEIDTYVLVSGDHSLLHVIAALRNRGARTAVVGVEENTARALGEAADTLLFYHGAVVSRTRGASAVAGTEVDDALRELPEAPTGAEAGMTAAPDAREDAPDQAAPDAAALADVVRTLSELEDRYPYVTPRKLSQSVWNKGHRDASELPRGIAPVCALTASLSDAQIYEYVVRAAQEGLAEWIQEEGWRPPTLRLRRENPAVDALLRARPATARTAAGRSASWPPNSSGDGASALGDGLGR